MPQRAKVHTLPDNIKQALDMKLIAEGFANYVSLSSWLEKMGYEISKSALHRYGSEFETRLASIKIATQQAQAIAEAAGDDQGVLGDALTRLVQEKTFQLLIEMESIDPEKMDFTKLGRMVAELNKASIQQKRWINEMKDKTVKTADEVVKTAKAGGLSAEKAEHIRRQILGIV